MTLERILLTHGHIDHAGGTADSRGAPACRSRGRTRPTASGSTRCHAGAQLRLRARRSLHARPLAARGRRGEGRRRDAAGAPLPGPHAGHVVFLNPTTRFAIVGDVLFAGSIGRTDFPRGDHARCLPRSASGSSRWATTSLPAGPRAELDLRRGTAQQSVRRGPLVRALTARHCLAMDSAASQVTLPRSIAFPAEEANYPAGRWPRIARPCRPKSTMSNPTPLKIDVTRYFRMEEAGIFGEDGRGGRERVELIEGEILEMPPPNPPHSSAVSELYRLLVDAIPRSRAIVWCQGTVVLSKFTAPQPDLVLLPPRDHRFRDQYPRPEDIWLAIEVSDTSLAYDRGRKNRLYASSGVPEYWLLDVPGRAIEIRRQAGRGRLRDPAARRSGRTHRARSAVRLPDRLGPRLRLSPRVLSRR